MRNIKSFGLSGLHLFETLTVLALLSCAGCSSGEVEMLKAQRNQAREELQQLQFEYIEQNKELTSILEELNSLAGKTLTLQQNYEGIDQPMSQAEQIGESIDVLKQRLDELELANSQLSSMTGMVQSLRTMVKKQENEINSLKQTIRQYEREIEHKNMEISRNKLVIEEQHMLITEKNSQLATLSEDRLAQLYNAGLELEKLADDENKVLKLNGRRNKETGALYKTAIYEKSLLFYELASTEGHALSAERIPIVKAKMALLK